MRRRCDLLLGVIVILLCLGCAPVAWAQAANSLVSVNTAGTDGGNAASGGPSVTFATHERSTSADGRFVVFISFATDLTAISDTNGLQDVFVRDRLLGTTTLLSVNLAGTAAGNFGGLLAFISPDGSKVAFESNSDDLVAGGIDANGAADVYVRHLSGPMAGTTELVSINAAGTAASNFGASVQNCQNAAPVELENRVGERRWSADGARFLFNSVSTDLVTGVSGCLYVRDLTLGTTIPVDVNTSGATAEFNGIGTFLSADGTKVAFSSGATDLVTGITDVFSGGLDVFVRDLSLGITSIITLDTSGTTAVGDGSVGNDSCFVSSFSEDGNLVAFTCFGPATELVAGITDFNGGGLTGADVFVHNISGGATTLVSGNSAGTGTGNARSQNGMVSPDCSRIAFQTDATDLVAGVIDANTSKDLLVYEVAGGAKSYATINAAGTDACTALSFPADTGVYYASWNTASDMLAFASGCTDLVTTPAVTGVPHVYVRNLGAGTTTLQDPNSTGTDGSNFGADFPFMSADGSTVIFVTDSSDLGPTDTNMLTDVYTRPLVVPEVSINDVSVPETNAGTTTATFTVTLSAPMLDPVTVDFQTFDNTATLADSDYVTATGTVIFPPGDTSEPVTVTINGDTSFEPTETFFVNLTMASNATILDGQGVGTITTDDGISINDVTVTEGDAGTVVANFTVSLSSPSGSTVTVDFTTLPNTAAAGPDFVTTGGTVTFMPTDVSEPVTVTVNGDMLDEINETFFVSLSNASGATILDIQGVGTITDDDPTLPGAGPPSPLVSINDAGTNSGNAGSFMAVGVVGLPGCLAVRQCLSADGRFLVFLSFATDLTPIPDTNGLADIFVRDTLLGTTTLVSVNAAGTAASNQGVVNDAVISADGTKVAFVSLSSDLVATDTNGGANTNDVFVRDLGAGTTTLVSVNAAGTDSGNATSGTGFGAHYLAISDDGNRIAFASEASNLTGLTDTNFSTDIFVRDLMAGTTSLASVNTAGTAAGNGLSIHPTLSSDGTKVAFVSFATSLVATPDTNGGQDVFVRNLTLGSTALVSLNSAGTASGNIRSTAPSISSDGSRVAFLSEATNLVSPDASTNCDVFVRDLAGGVTFLASINSAGTASGNSGVGTSCATAIGTTVSPALNSDGSVVAFVSTATDLVTLADTNGIFGWDVFVRNLTAGATTLASVNSAGTSAGNAASANPGFFDAVALDDSGQVVVFQSGASDLTTPAGAPVSVYARDLTAGTTTLIDLNSAGTAAASGANIALSRDGSTVAFDSGSSSLTPAGLDTNSGASDVFLRPLVVTPSISINDLTVTEGDAGTSVATFTVSLSAPSVATITVDFMTNGVTATSGTDFVGNTGTVTFMPTDVTEPVTVTINGDLLDELNETFTVDLSSAMNATLIDSQGVGTINDNDPTPTLSINDVTVPEGAAGTSNAMFTVSLSALSGLNVSVDFTTNDNSATQPSDYTLTTGTVMIPAGTLTAPINVPVLGDLTTEPNETFFVDLSLPSNATIADVQGVGTISNDDGVTISIDDVSVTEGNAGTVNATFTVSLAQASGSTVTVDFMTNGVTASGTDFVSGTGTVTFIPTDVSEPVTVIVNGDTLDELNETFTVDLSNAMNATILDSQGAGTITDDDPTPTLSISDVTVTEGSAGTSDASFTVSLSAASGLPVSVDFTTLDGSAMQPGDYTLTTGTLMIPPMTATLPILVPIVGDTTTEPDETFTVSLSLPLNATLVDGSGTGTITDDDSQDFTLTTVECCFECVAGFSASFNLTIAPTLDPVTTPVTFSCSGLPPLSTCTFTPSSVTPGSSPATSVLTVQTTGPAGSPSASLRPSAPTHASFFGGAGMGLVAMLLMGRGGRRRKLRAGLGALLALAALSLGGLSCAFSGPRTPAGTYNITITATGANFTKTLPVTLIVRD